MKALVAAAALVAAVTLTGCSAGAGSSSGASDDAGGSVAGSEAGTGSGSGSRALTGEPGAAPDTTGADTTGTGTTAGGPNRAAVRTAAVVKRGEITLTSRDVPRARREISRLLERVGGNVDQERSGNGRDGRVDRSTLVLRVPVDRFAEARDAIAALGKVKTSTETAEDVTTQVIDTDERVQTLQNSLDRLQRFQRSAEDVKDLIAFEQDITARQAELQSLKSQQAYLVDQTSLSTITVRLSTPAAYTAPPRALDDAGFLAGLRGGWRALVGVVVVALTAVGAVLPFALPSVLVGVPLWRLLRRRRTARAAAGTPA